SVVAKQRLAAVEERAVVAAPERPLSQAVRRVLVLNVLRGQTQSALLRLDIDRQVAGCGAVILLVFSGHEVHEMRLVVAPRPAPALRQPDIETQEHGVGRREQMAYPGG